MKNILVPIDFSKASTNALRFAIKIAHATTSKIFIYHSMHPLFIPSDAAMIESPLNLEEETKADLALQMNELLEDITSQNVQAEMIIQKGLLGDTISEITSNKNIDMIVTGTTGAKGLDAMLFGTNSVNIFEHVKCPVFIVPENSKYHGIKKIMYATDFQFGDIKAIDKICQLALMPK
jgi:nucleotide-binding universal stress UspA family protein